MEVQAWYPSHSPESIAPTYYTTICKEPHRTYVGTKAKTPQVPIKNCEDSNVDMSNQILISYRSFHRLNQTPRWYMNLFVFFKSLKPKAHKIVQTQKEKGSGNQTSNEE